MSGLGTENVGEAEEEADQSKLFKKILSEMHNEFNKYQGPITNPYVLDSKDTVPKSEESEKIEEKTENESVAVVKPEVVADAQETPQEQERAEDDEEEETKVDSEPPADQPRIILKLKTQEDLNRSPSEKKSCKQSSKSRLVSYADEPTEKRTRRGSKYSAEAELPPKRTSRRTSRDFSKESVLQNAIARKEKSLISFSLEEKPRRSSRISDELRSAAKLRGKMLTRSLAAGSTDQMDEPGAAGAGDSPGRASSGNKRSPSESTSHDPHLETDDTSSDVSSVEPVNRRPRSFKSSKESSPEWVIQHDPNMECAVDSLTCTPESTKKKVMNEENGLRLKMSSASPRIPEASEPPSHPTREVQKDIPEPESYCECDRVTSLYVKNAQHLLCQALDTYDDKLVKCSNLADDKVPLLRASKIVPFQQHCLVHFQRSMRHNACPTCSIFCTQGVFLVCVNRHFFHKDCGLKTDDSTVCPHCGSNSYSPHRVQLQNHVYPLLLPPTKPIDRTPLARITFHKSMGLSSQKKVVDSDEEIDELVKPLSMTLPTGKIITSEGIPLVEKQKLELLMNHSSSPHDQKNSHRNLYSAAKGGDDEKVFTILVSGLSPNQPAMNPLHAAVREGHLLIVHLLVQAGASLEILDKGLYSPLMVAVSHKHNDVVKYLIRSGASKLFKGLDGMTALHIAAKEGNLEAVHYLLTVANTPRSFIDTVDDGRWTALVWAAENSHYRIVRYLLEKGADPHIRDKEMNTALHWAAFSGSMEISEDLLNYGCNVNLSNAHGDTPLHIAARQAADNCVVLLLARGARVDAVNKAGQIPRDCVLVPDSYCKTAIEMNMCLRKTVDPSSFTPKILSNDVSLGREENPIQCVNAIDNEEMPTDYTYVTENCYTSNIAMDRRISSLLSCKCTTGDCLDGGCMCCKISRGSWYDASGKLVPEFSFEDPPMIFECNRACGCNMLTCRNRVVQRGLKTRLQLCKTKDKSWGVITLKNIPKGAYVCEYVGEIISDLEADTRKDDSYLFDLDNAEFGLSLVSPRNSYDFEGETYCLDARKYGNICRFINHSCRPNLAPVKVFYEHHDLHFPRIAMFATRDIAADEELGFDYGDKFWIIKCKSFTCHCGEERCRYSESTIQQTLDKYQEKLKELDEIEALV